MKPIEIWEGRTASSIALRLALTPLSCLYAIGWQAYLGIYKLGIKKASEPHRPVVCVGNLVTGGSGKSPMTCYLADLLSDMGYQVVVGCSGYGAPHSEAATIAPDGVLDAAEWGDEPAMFRDLMPSVPLVVGRRRVLAAGLVHERFPGAVLLMDDGFQHLPVAKQVTILLDDPNPKNRFCLPAGPYREPRMNRRRASLVLPDRFSVQNAKMKLLDSDGRSHSPTSYSVLCALGQPSKFLLALESEFPNHPPGGTCALLPDHDPLSSGTLLDGFSKDLPIVVTAKDWVKLKRRNDIDPAQFLIATQRVWVEPEAEFKKWLADKLHE